MSAGRVIAISAWAAIAGAWALPPKPTPAVPSLNVTPVVAAAPSSSSAKFYPAGTAPIAMAPASADKASQFFPNGLSVEMQPEDLWHIATDMPKGELPPAQFDRGTKRPVAVIDVSSEDRLRTLCGWPASKGETLVGCAAPSGEVCKIYLGPPQTARTGVTRNLILRHELGHCEGWPADHSNPPAPLQLAADEGLVPAEEDYPPPPPPRRRPPPRYYEPAPPPGWIFIPSEQRAMPCLPTLLSFGLARFCI